MATIPQRGPQERRREPPTARDAPWQRAVRDAPCFATTGVRASSGAAEVAAIDKAKEILGYDLAALIRDGPQAKLDETLYSQPIVFVTSLAYVEVAKKHKREILGRSKTCAGFSLGEYTALVYANVMSFEDGLRLVQARAEAMDAAAKAADASMASS